MDLTSRIAWALVGVVFTYFFVPVVVSAVGARVGRASSAAERRRTFLLLAGTGPYLISAALCLGLTFFPGLFAAVYVSSICFLFIAVSVFFRQDVRAQFIEVALGLCAAFKPLLGVRALLVSAVVFLLAYQWSLSLRIPLTENDPLEYFQAARLISADRSLLQYPFTQPERVGGFYAPWSHLPGFVGLISWGMLWEGEHTALWIAKSIAPFYTAATSALLIGWLLPWGLHVGCIAALFLMGSAFYFKLGIISHIDTLRLYAFTLVFAAIAQWRNSGARSWGVVASLGVALSLFSHSSGFLVLPMAAAALWFASCRELRTRTKVILLVLVGGVLPVLPKVLNNFLLHGKLVVDIGGSKVFLLPNLHYDEYVRLTRGIAHWSDRIVNGLLIGFSRTSFYGLAYYTVLLGGVGLYFIRKRNTSLEGGPAGGDTAKEAGTGVVIFYVLALLSLFVGSDTFIKNERYMMTPQPLVAAIGAVLTEHFRLIRWQSLSPRYPGACRAGVHLVLAALLLKAFLDAINMGKEMVLSVGYQSLAVRDDWNALRRLPAYRLIDHIRKATPKEAVFLSLRSADFAYYADRTFINHTDPRLIPFYSAQTVSEGREALKALNISYVFTPGYFEPFFYNSVLGDILANPAQAHLFKEEGDYRVFALGDYRPMLSSLAIWCDPSTKQFDIDGRRDLEKLGGEPGSVHFRNPAFISKWGFAQEVTVSSRSPLLNYRVIEPCTQGKIRPAESLLFRAQAGGTGFLTIYFKPYRKGDPQRPIFVWEGALRGVARSVGGQFQAPPEGVDAFQIVFVLRAAEEFSTRDWELWRVGLGSRAQLTQQEGTELISGEGS